MAGYVTARAALSTASSGAENRGRAARVPRGLAAHLSPAWAEDVGPGHSSRLPRARQAGWGWVPGPPPRARTPAPWLPPLPVSEPVLPRSGESRLCVRRLCPDRGHAALFPQPCARP